MTCSNGAFSPHPLANPFNTRLGPSNYSLNPCKNADATRQFHTAGGNPRNLQVPNQEPTYDQVQSAEQAQLQRKSLQVPNQDIPLGDNLGRRGFLKKNSSLFRCLDGTVLDFKTGKVIHSPNDPSLEYWGNPDATVSKESSIGTWNDEETVDSLIANIDQYYGRATPGSNGMQVDSKSAKYWLQAEEEAEKLQTEMSDEQKKMLADFEKHFPRSKLVEESKKAQDGNMI